MFGNHRGRDGHDPFGRHRGGHHHPHEMRGGRGGRGRERMFEQGDLRLVILSLLNERPRHGYEVIKAIEDLAGGEYTPSAGVIYPTLTLLEELGQAVVTQEQGGKKQYGITDEGKALLESQGDVLARVRDRLSSASQIGEGRNAPELQRAMQNFRTALHLRLGRGPLEQDAVRKIADAIDAAAVQIERA